MLSQETVNKFETPSNKSNLIPKSSATENQKNLDIFCKDLSKINELDECGWTPLYRTIIAGDIFSTTLLLNNGADPNIQCTMGETPLFQAVDMEKIDHVKLLLKNGADPNIPNDDGLTPLHLAVIKQNIPIVKILLKYNANPNIKSKLYQQTPLHLAIKNNTDPMILLLLVQFNGSLTNEDKFKKKPIDYTNSKEMQSTIEKLKFDQENSTKIKEVHNFQTPRKNYGWTPSNVYSNTIRSQSHRKEFFIEGNNAILQNPGNLKYTIISGKNNISSNISNNKNNNVTETVKKDLFNSSEKLKMNNNQIDQKIDDKNNINFEDNINNLNLEEEKREKNESNKKIKIMKFLEDKENINPNKNISFSLHKSKTGKFGTILEENSLNESRQNNNSIKPIITKKSSNDSNSSENDKSIQHKEVNFSFSTNTFNNNKNKTSLSQSIKQENEDNKENINTNNFNENINLNEQSRNNNSTKSTKKTKEKKERNNNINNSNKKKIIIKSYYNKEGKKERINNKNSNKEKDNKTFDGDDYLYEKIIKKSITKIEIYDENYDERNNYSEKNNTEKNDCDEIKNYNKKINSYEKKDYNNSNIDNESINKLSQSELNEDDSKPKSPNKSLYNKPIIKNKFNLKKIENINMRPSIEPEIDKSNNSLLDNSFPKRSTFSAHTKNFLIKNNSFHNKKLASAKQANPENNKNLKIKNIKSNSLTRTSMTTLGASGNEVNLNQNSLWKFLNDIITNEKTYQSFITNNINSDIDNEYEITYKYPIYNWLKEINLHCYYSLFKEKGIYSMDKVISNLKTGKYNITKNDIEKIGILIPGHIYRIITKLEIDSSKISEKICKYFVKNKNRKSGKEVKVTNNSVYYCCGCCSSNEQIHNFGKMKKFFNLELWLNKIKLIKYKQNFIENGFDLFEYFILQMFTILPIDDNILRDELNIENDKDRDIILLRLNKDVKYIIQKAENDDFYYNNSYEIGEQRNFEENNLYEFDTEQNEKSSGCIII